MNKTEKKFKEYMNSNLTVEDSFQNIVSKIDFNEEKKTMKRKKLFVVSGAALATCLIVGVGAFALLNRGNDPKFGSPKALVSVDVNPSIDLVVDENNYVISINGNNDDGKLIITGENIVGKTLDQALEIIIEIENDTGYLLSGNVDAEENKISISISADNEQIKNEIETKVSEKIQEVCDELNINQVIEEFEKYSDVYLNELLLKIDPTLEDKINSLTYEEKLEIIASYQKEASQICSKQLEELYVNAKNYEISFSEKDSIRNFISDVDSKYQDIVAAYSDFVSSLETKANDIETLRYNLLVDPNSSYQKALVEFNNYKKQIDDLKKQIALEENEIEKMMLEMQVEVIEPLIITAEELLMNAQEGANDLLDDAKELLLNIVAKLKEMEEEFPDEIKGVLTSKTIEIENAINKTKNNFFKEFEDKYQEDIAKAKKALEERKQELINVNK